LFVWVFGLCPLQAQSIAPVRTGNYVMEHYTTDNGLPSNAVVGLAWEKNGHVILATEAGIVRFDGLRFYLDTLSRKPFFKMTHNINGELIAFSRNGSLYEIRDGEVCQYHNLFFSSHTKTTLNRLSLIRMTFKRFYEHAKKENPEFFWLNDLTIYPLDPNVFLENINDRIHVCNIETNQHYFTVPKSNALDDILIFMGQNSFLFSPDGKLNEINLKHKSLKQKKIINLPQLKKGERFRVIYSYKQKYPIIQKEHEAWIILPLPNGEFYFEKVADCIPPQVLVMYAEYLPDAKVLLLGTQSNGLLLIRKSPFKQLLPLDRKDYQGTSYYLQMPVGDGRILTNHGTVLGTSDGSPYLKIPPYYNIGNSWYRDPFGNIWFAKMDSLIRFNTNTNKAEFIAYQETPAPEKTVFIGRNDTTYIANANGLFRAVGNSFEKIHAYPSPLIKSPFPEDIEIYKNSLLISTNNGLYQYDFATEMLQRIFYVNEVSIRDIWIKEDVILLGTYGGGIYRYKNGTFEAIPLDEQGYLAFAHCFSEDNYGNLWISTNRGVFKVRSRTLLHAPVSKINYYSYVYLGLADGLATTELNGGCSPCVVNLGSVISFPSMNGLIQFNPHEVHIPKEKYNLRVEQIFINDLPYTWYPGRSIQLNESIRNLKVQVSMPWWGNPGNIHLDYRLKGFEANPNSFEYPKSSLISYSHLPSGKFMLIIRRLDSKYDSEVVSFIEIPIIINQPWYGEWWGLLILAILGTFLIIFVINFRINRIEKQKKKLSRIIGEQTREMKSKNKELITSVDKMRKSQMILEENNRMKNHVISILSHDLVTPLRYLSMAGRGVLNNPERYTRDDLFKMIQDMVNTTQQLEILSSNILNWIKYFRTNRVPVIRTFELHEMINRQQESLQMFFKNKNNKFHNQVPEATYISQIPEPLGVIIFNLISNANKYTKEGDVSVDYEEQGDYFTLYVSDTGSGIPNEKIERILKGDPIESSPDTEMMKGNGLGYLIIRELLTLIKGQLSIESEPGAGTTVSIRLPKEA